VQNYNLDFIPARKISPLLCRREGAGGWVEAGQSVFSPPSAYLSEILFVFLRIVTKFTGAKSTMLKSTYYD
jgi:hypothetical protein